jgi:hypothetical protein
LLAYWFLSFVHGQHQVRVFYCCAGYHLQLLPSLFVAITYKGHTLLFFLGFDFLFDLFVVYEKRKKS